MDANTYFLNQYLHEEQSEEDREADLYQAELEWKCQQEKEMMEEEENKCSQK